MHVHFLLCLDVKHPSIHHSMDIWHKAKKLRKALNEVRSCELTSCKAYTTYTCSIWKGIVYMYVSLCRQEKSKTCKSWHNGVVT